MHTKLMYLRIQNNWTWWAKGVQARIQVGCHWILSFVLLLANSLSFPAFETKKYMALAVSMETVGMVKSRRRKNQSEHLGLPCQIIKERYFLSYELQ